MNATIHDPNPNDLLLAVESKANDTGRFLYEPVGIISPNVIAFGQTIDATSTPLYVDVDPVDGAKALECHYNVLRHVALHGGAMVSGWHIEEQDNIQLTANFHSVWYSGTGLLDVTPHLPGDRRIIFLPDNNRIFDGEDVPSLYMSLHPEDGDVTRMLQLHNRVSPDYVDRNMRWHPLAGHVAITPEGIFDSLECSRLNAALTLRYGDPSLHEAARHELRRLDHEERKQRRRFGLNEHIRRTQTHNHAPNLKEPCPCGSGRKYKNCCRKIGK